MKPSSFCLFVGAVLAIAGCDDASSASPPAGSASATSTAATGSPQITASEPVFEFGKVKLGTVVEHVFKVKNVGDAPLKIARAKGS